MYSFVVNKKPYAIPLSAEELTLGQYMALCEANNELDMLTALMGEVPTTSVSSQEEAEQFGRELEGCYKLIGLLQQDIDHTIDSGLLLVAPKMVTIMGLPIVVKENFVNTLPYWGYAHTKAAITNRAKLGKDENFNGTDLIPDIIAHNMYALVTKSPYNEAKAEDFVEVIKEMNWIEAMRLGNFFFLQQRKLWVSKRKRFTISLGLLKSKLVSMFLINTHRSTPLKRFHLEMLRSGKK